MSLVRTVALCISSLLAGGAAAEVPASLSVLCPKAAPSEIVVCADGEPPASPYRLPLPVDPVAGDRNLVAVSRERNALIEPDAGGTGSCSASGAGGWTGCQYRSFKQNVQQAAGSRDVRGRIHRDKVTRH